MSYQLKILVPSALNVNFEKLRKDLGGEFVSAVERSEVVWSFSNKKKAVKAYNHLRRLCILSSIEEDRREIV